MMVYPISGAPEWQAAQSLASRIKARNQRVGPRLRSGSRRKGVNGKFAIAAGNSGANANNYSPARVNGSNVVRQHVCVF
ncbi:MAG TPA: hypothetical protein VJQ77_01070 [Novosphingobium sp.]|nr:hypothetical protein [Novosphingobium sp.]